MKQGFIAITTVLVISAVALSAVATVMILGIGELQGSYSGVEAETSLALVEGCAEDALQEVHDSSTWAGGTLVRPEGNCIVTINSGNPNWDITVAASAGNYQRRVQIIFSRGTSITITSWEEI